MSDNHDPATQATQAAQTGPPRVSEEAHDTVPPLPISPTYFTSSPTSVTAPAGIPKIGSPVPPSPTPFNKDGTFPSLPNSPAATQSTHDIGSPVNPTMTGPGFHPLTTVNSQRTSFSAATNTRPSLEARRSEETRLADELEMLRAEQLFSARTEQMQRIGSRLPPIQDEDDDPDHYNPGEPSMTVDPIPSTHPHLAPDENAPLFRLWKWLKKFPRLFRYMLYAVPGAAILMAPVLIGRFVPNKEAHAVGGHGGVYLEWFGIWLEIMWCSLWVARMITSLMPYIFKGVAAMMGSVSAKKWRDIGRDLELHTALFLWMLAMLISTRSILNGHRAPTDEDPDDLKWVRIVIKIIIAVFVLAALNFVEKILIKWIASSFHQRTYAVRIVQNKEDISRLVKLYEHSKTFFHPMDSVWQPVASRPGSSSFKNPIGNMKHNARQAWGKMGNVAGRIGNDFIGRKTVNDPRKVVGELLRNAQQSRALARIIYRSLRNVHAMRADAAEAEEMDRHSDVMSEETNEFNEKGIPDGSTPTDEQEEHLVYIDDFKLIFKDDDEAEAAFSLFDKDMNGDISMEEFEGVCYEIHLEKKAISASLKDLDSVINKLDRVLFCVVFVISVIVFASIISNSTASALSSAGTTILGLSWLLQNTTQEFLQSLVFVFVKHPFDVGDRVTVYGNSGTAGLGDDYYVTEISLWYTEFKKMEGHIVQAPNSILNTLFILNQRRSNSIADVIALKVRFGTTQAQVEQLKSRMLAFVNEHRRDYLARILTEVRTLDNMSSATINIIFFHKSNFQNELLRLSRHNVFLTELMQQMVEVGIQPPFKAQPGGSKEHPMYWQQLQTQDQGESTDGAPFGRIQPDDDLENFSLHGKPSRRTVRGGNDASASTRDPLDTRSIATGSEQRIPIVRQDGAFDDFQDVYSMRKNNRPARWNTQPNPQTPGLRLRRGSHLQSHDGQSLAPQESFATGAGGSSFMRESMEQGSEMGGIRRMATQMSRVSTATSRRFWPRPRARTHSRSGNNPLDDPNHVNPDGSIV